ncbi:uncharacterized protein DUF3367 [Nonomuraea fuscirosea]|uniref:Uncharacterized protein DUF3367 n=1 Tax=Nonomuraea fuscirosea TaxID=1291556 RepID=A0A2T0N7J4_9ACTN|nr:alpha-(1->3)-arabinofuranosyltransferase family protein [Nonomuraea fuscirosea]PRX68495.1 uncharacterized protein DUF3367 [Nonomuraea fuscirosea]
MLRTVRAGPASALLGLALGCLALGPALGWGFTLLQDMVFVPEPEFSPFTFGLAGGAARVVPSDAVVTALAQVLPAELVQKAILLAVFVLGCSGAALLLPSGSLGPRLVAGAFYVWNPYVAERLLIGQWALLLGYAGLPWVVRAVWAGRRVALAMLPAAVGGFAAMTVTAITSVPVALSRWRVGARDQAKPPDHAGPRAQDQAGRSEGRWWGVVRVVGVLALFSLPWLVPTALRPHGIAGDPVGVDAFAARADTPFGAVGSLLSLGGIWNRYAVPPGYESVVGAVARLALTLAGVVAFLRSRAPYRTGLAVAAGAGLAVACAGVSEPGREAFKWLVQVWGGFAVFRDAQQFVAPLALAAALGLGALAQSVAQPMTGSVAGPVAGPVAGSAVGRRAWTVALVLVPLAVLPTMAWGSLGRLGSVSYPASWTAAREIIRRDPAPGDVLVLPFESYRQFPWNGGRAVLDPAQRFFATPGRRVVSGDAVRVGGLVVRSEDPRAREVERVLEGPSPDLAAAGFRYVIVDAGTLEERHRFGVWLRSARVLVDTGDLGLYRFERVGGRA